MSSGFASSPLLGGGTSDEELRAEIEDVAIAYDPAPSLGMGANLLDDGSFETGTGWRWGAGWTVPHKAADAYDGRRTARLRANGSSGHLISNRVRVSPLDNSYWVSFHHRVTAYTQGALRAVVRCLNDAFEKIEDIEITRLNTLTEQMGDTPTPEFDDLLTDYGATIDPGTDGWLNKDHSTYPAGLPGYNEHGWTTSGGVGTFTSRYISGHTSGAVSRWFFSPVVAIRDGATFEFDMWTGGRGAIEVRASTHGDSTRIGSAPSEVGDFTYLLYQLKPSASITPGWQTYQVALHGIEDPGQGRIAFRYHIPAGVADDLSMPTLTYRDTFSRTTTPPALPGYADTGEGWSFFTGGGVETLRADGSRLHFQSNGEAGAAATAIPNVYGTAPAGWMIGAHVRVRFDLELGSGSSVATPLFDLYAANNAFRVHNFQTDDVDDAPFTLATGQKYEVEYEVWPGHYQRARIWPAGSTVPAWGPQNSCPVPDSATPIQIGLFGYNNLYIDNLVITQQAGGDYGIVLKAASYSLTTANALPWQRYAQRFGPIQETELEVPLPINTTYVRLLFEPVNHAILTAELDAVQVLRGWLDAPFKSAPVDGISGEQIIAGTLPMSALDATPPDAPGQITLDSEFVLGADGSQMPYVQATWEPSPSDDVTGYEVQIAHGDTPDAITFDTPTASRTSALGHYTEDVRGDLYYGVRVAALDRANNRSEWSEVVHVQAGGGNTVALPIPTGLILYAGIKLLRCDWDDITNPNLAYFQVRFRETAGPGAWHRERVSASFAVIANLTGTTDQSFFYDVQVRAVDRNGYVRASASDPQAVKAKNNPEAGWCGIVSEAPKLVETLDMPVQTGVLTIETGAPAVGYVARVPMPYGGTITKVEVANDAAGSIEWDIYKDTYANFPPVAGDSITASAKPKTVSALTSQDTTLTGWTTGFNGGDWLIIWINSGSGVTSSTLAIYFTKG